MKTCYKLMILSLAVIILPRALAAESDVNWLSADKPVKSGFVFNLEVIKADSNFVYFKMNDHYFDHNTMASWRDISLKLDEFHRYNLKSGEDSIISLVLGSREKSRDFLTLIVVDGKIHIISVFKNASLRKFYLFDETINMNSFKLNNDMRKLSEIGYEETNVKNAWNFKLNVEKMNGWYMFKYNYGNNNRTSYGVEVYDTLLNPVWNMNYNASVDKGDCYEGNYVVDYDGNLYSTQRSYPIKMENDNAYTSSRLFVVFYPRDGSTPRAKQLDLLGDKFITAAQLGVNSDNQLICMGLYSDNNRRSAMGAFSFVFINHLEDMVSRNIKPFDREFFLKGENDQNQAILNFKLDNKREIEETFSYNMGAVHFRKDGSSDLTIEKTKTIFYKSNYVDTWNFIMNDLIVLNCAPDGAFRWVQKIPKAQDVDNEYEKLGHYLLSYGENDKMNYIITLPGLKTTDEKGKNVKNNHTFIITLDRDGKDSVRELFNDPIVSKTFCPTFSKDVGNDRIILTRCNHFLGNLLNFKKFGTINFGEMQIK
jgi:hypothetical protein